jgi:hypothetical protein
MTETQTPDVELAGMFEQLLTLNTQSFAARHFEVAYHLLASAMHCARDLKDRTRLGVVKQAALDQGRWIDGNAQQHPLSSLRARARGNEGIYLELARTADSMVLQVQVDEEVEKVRRLHERKT